jgi:hypothetical protein
MRKVTAATGPIGSTTTWRPTVNGIIYLVGLVVVIIAVLSFFGLR